MPQWQHNLSKKNDAPALVWRHPTESKEAECLEREHSRTVRGTAWETYWEGAPQWHLSLVPVQRDF
jgi:hypothetical protein